MTAIVWTEPARQQLLSLESVKSREQITRAVGGLSNFPRKGPIVSEAQDDPELAGIRQLVIPGQCRVLYQYFESLRMIAVLGIQFRGQHLTPEILEKYFSGE